MNRFSRYEIKYEFISLNYWQQYKTFPYKKRNLHEMTLENSLRQRIIMTTTIKITQNLKINNMTRVKIIKRRYDEKEKIKQNTKTSYQQYPYIYTKSKNFQKC